MSDARPFDEQFDTKMEVERNPTGPMLDRYIPAPVTLPTPPECLRAQ